MARHAISCAPSRNHRRRWPGRVARGGCRTPGGISGRLPGDRPRAGAGSPGRTGSRKRYLPALVLPGVLPGERSADDAGLVLQLRRHDRRVELDVGQELVGLLADAAADDEEVGPEPVLEVTQVVLHALGPLLP